MKVIKRDGRAVEFNSDKISIAIEKANMEVSDDKRASATEIDEIIKYIEQLDKKRILVEDIQDIIEQKLMEIDKYELAKKYIVYRYTRTLVRKQNTTDESILGLIKNPGDSGTKEDENRKLACVQRRLIAGEVSKDLTKRILLPEKITKAHEDGIINFHNMEYFLQPIINSCYINVGDMLDNGTGFYNDKIETPKSFYEACIILSQIINITADNQYGKVYINIAHLGKYLRKSYDIVKNDILQENSESLNKNNKEITKKIVQREISEGIYAIKIQIESLINIYDNNPRICLIMINDFDDDYYKENQRIFEEILKQKIDNCEFITDNEVAQKYQYEGRFNYGIVDINIEKIIALSEKNEKIFWKLLDEKLELCYEALMCRHYALLGATSDVSPIHWQNGAISRLQPGEKIDKLLKDGYSELTLRCDFGDTAKNQVSSKVIKYIEDKVQSWKKMTGIGFSCEF